MICCFASTLLFGMGINALPVAAASRNDGTTPAPNGMPGSIVFNYGGPIIKNVHAQPIWYGSVSHANDIFDFYSAVTASPWMDVLSQYGVGRGTAYSAISVPSTTSDLDDSENIKPLLLRLIQTKAIRVTADSYFPIHLSLGVTATNQDGQKTCSSVCGYHNAIDISDMNIPGVKYVAYSVIPDMDSCGVSCGGGNADALKNLYTVASHEMAEALTNPAESVAFPLNAAPMAWYWLDGLKEVADICNAQQATTVGADGKTYAVQNIWSNVDNACVSISAKPKKAVKGNPKSKANPNAKKTNKATPP
ncbi:hypothetical protein BC830DRAFT_1226845 [Chytriomyces sp. MP71]|nr:hypothetical protein BC830DRAFT_1226845 [Chytriomyces sp. MP71]